MWRDFQTWLARRTLLAAIRRRGWVGTHVPVGDLGFAYTTGFMESAGSPEVIMFGVTKAEAGHIASEIWRDLESGTLVLTDKARWPAEETPKLMLREVHPTQIRREYFNVAIWYRTHRGLDRDGLRAFQLVWPDTQGVFPWEPGYDLDYRPRQLALYEPYEGTIDEHAALETFHSLSR
jgi:hypothetical protein